MQSGMVWLAQRHLFTIDGRHLHGEPIQMLVLHLQTLNRTKVTKVMHLYLNTATDNTSLTQITSSKFISPTNFQPLQRNRIHLKKASTLKIRRLVELGSSILASELASKLLERSPHSAKLKLFCKSKPATIAQVVYKGTQARDIVPKRVVVQQTTNYPIIVFDNVSMIKIHHTLETCRPNTVLAINPFEKSAAHQFIHQLIDRCIQLY